MTGFDEAQVNQLTVGYFTILSSVKVGATINSQIDKFARGKVLPRYLGEDYCRIYATHRRDESRRFHNVVSDVDFDWYLRAV